MASSKREDGQANNFINYNIKMPGKQTKAQKAREERIKNNLKELEGKRTENDIFNTRLDKVKGLYSSGTIFSFKSALKLLKRVETPTAKNETFYNNKIEELEAKGPRKTRGKNIPKITVNSIDPRTRLTEKTALKWFNIVEITNIHDKSLKGFKHLNAQHAKLKEYLDKFQGLLAKVSVTYEMEKTTENKIYPLYNHTKKSQ